LGTEYYADMSHQRCFLVAERLETGWISGGIGVRLRPPRLDALDMGIGRVFIVGVAVTLRSSLLSR